MALFALQFSKFSGGERSSAFGGCFVRHPRKILLFYKISMEALCVGSKQLTCMYCEMTKGRIDLGNIDRDATFPA